MDLYCPKCGEPWDFDSLHDEAQSKYGIPYYIEDDHYASLRSRDRNPLWNADAYDVVYQKVKHEFQRIGCVALGAKCSEPSTEVDRTFGLTRQDAASALYDILGDDMDGAAAMLEDMGY